MSWNIKDSRGKPTCSNFWEKNYLVEIFCGWSQSVIKKKYWKSFENKKAKNVTWAKNEKREGIVSLTRLIENEKMPSRDSLELWLVIYQNQFFLYITIPQKLRHERSSVVEKVPQGDALTLLTVCWHEFKSSLRHTEWG